MRLWLSGGTGFIGSNVRRVFAERHDADVRAPAHADVDLVDRDAVLADVAAHRPDAVVHTAILNDLRRVLADRAAGWAAYVDATRHVVDAANAVGAKVVLVSTDWVFDGTQSGADERTPPNPVNLYGVLKLASELVVGERAVDGAVARVGAVNGVHWARPAAPRAQDAGFGYFVASLVDALEAGRTFTVWDSADINMVATPSLASECAELLWRIVDTDGRGTYHCVGGQRIGRLALAELAADVFELDPSLLRTGPPTGLPPMRVPYDTSLSAAITAARLGVQLLDVRSQLLRLRAERATGDLG